MTEETGAAAPADELAAQSAPTESEQATPAQSVPQDAAPDAETEAKPQGQADTQSSEESDDKPRKPSRSERMRRRMQAMATELESLRTQLSPRQNETKDQEPKEADFNGDYFAYQSAKIAFDTRQAIRSEIEGDRQRQAQERLAAQRADAVEDFEERAAEFKVHVTDFDATIRSFVDGGGKFSEALVDELRDSDMGPALAYQLAKNPQKVAELNAMSARDVAREIGRLEAKVTLPNPKKQTSAPRPIVPPSGGATPPKDPSKMSMDEYVKWRTGGNG